jgi:hypothetical protein
MRNYWSDELRVLVHPVGSYRQLAAQATDDGPWFVLRRPLFVALVAGAFVSFTASGRLIVPLLLDGALFWSFVPILQMSAIAGVVLTLARGRMPITKAIDLFFVGHAPWLLWLLTVAGTCLFFPMKRIYLWPTQPGWLLPFSLLIAWIWSNVTTFGFLRGALDLTVRQSIVALLFYTVMLWGIVFAYLFAVESLQVHRLGL